jgi:hypothetical protein
MIYLENIYIAQNFAWIFIYKYWLSLVIIKRESFADYIIY